MKKKKLVSTIWCEGCSGCHMSFLDMDEKLVDLIKKGMAFSATPFTDLKIPPHGTDIGIIEGSVATDTQEEEVKMMRERCKIVIAIGDCAVFGGIPTMRNKYKTTEIFSRAYKQAETNHNQHLPSGEDISKLLDRVKPVNEVIKVDYYIPGCPPTPEAIYEALSKLIEDQSPELKGKLLSYE
ncbi:MAG: NADP oxidoreductase [Candidatus Calescibacterium sp.]|nr:NADP oxidoreductase [Candidatus Calescibacterium sp.]